MVLRLLATVLAVLALVAPVRAEGPEAVALLPLDADQRLEIYGQPVASEIARALVAGQIDVVVVGPRMTVPDRARLIVDGTITSGKADAVLLTVRVRNPVDGKVLATMSASAVGLATIDQAAADVSARVLPAVRERLAALRAPPPDRVSDRAIAPVRDAIPAADAPRPVLVAISGGAAASPFAQALTDEVTRWVRAHRREPSAVEPPKLGRKLATETVRASGTDLAISFEIGGFSFERAHGVPLARARVRVRIAGADRVVFDRVVITDTVVGERTLEPSALAARTAREVLAILAPHLRRLVPTW